MGFLQTDESCFVDQKEEPGRGENPEQVGCQTLVEAFKTFVNPYLMNTVCDPIVDNSLSFITLTFESQPLNLLLRVLLHLQTQSHHIHRHEKCTGKALAEASCEERNQKVVPRNASGLEAAKVVYVFVAVHLDHSIRSQKQTRHETFVKR